MFRHRQLILIAVLVFSLNHTNVSGGAPVKESALGLGARITAPAPLSLPGSNKLSKLQQAYLDAYSILSHDNGCTNFFGGSVVIHALNDLTGQLQPTYMDRQITVVMKGEITNVRTLNGYSYRLFHNAEINMLGPFYEDNRLPNRGKVPSIGGFSPNTREVRVAVLLHEVGHLVRGRNDQWLLPDDGKSPMLSNDNTLRIVAACGEQIRSLQSISFETELAALKAPAGAELVASKD